MSASAAVAIAVVNSGHCIVPQHSPVTALLHVVIVSLRGDEFLLCSRRFDHTVTGVPSGPGQCAPSKSSIRELP